MSCKKSVQEWRHAIVVLTSYARDFSGMEDKILPLLKYSYGDLKGEQVKSCLLYCALFLEDDRIPKEELVGYWIGEGIVDGSKGIERAENEGYDIIGSLVRASLLMEGVDKFRGDVVYMHYVVREMALWIASEKESFIVQAGVGLYGMPRVANWNVVRRMSLMENEIPHLVGRPKCFELTTLLIQKSNLATISSEFFRFMPKLVVLDLSNNKDLCEFPEGISKLVSLQYLNLSKTGILHLSTGLQQLKKLIHLELMETLELSSIAGISSLRNLKVLNLSRSGFSWDLNTVEELETLEHLEILTTRFNRLLDLKKFLSSHSLTSCTRLLEIADSNLDSLGIALPVTMDKLRDFCIRNCTISEINTGRIFGPYPRNSCFLSLCEVSIWNCKGLKELTWLMFAPNLKDLDFGNANELEDIINKEKACEGEESSIIPFLKLISLRLNNLLELKNIYWDPLPFPCLKRIDVFTCPNLKKLPLDSQNGMFGENRLIIRYTQQEWIEGVEWKDEATKTRFLEHVQRQL